MALEVQRNAATDPKLVMPFMYAVRDVFKTMARVDITTGRPTLKTTNKATHGVCGIIGFSGQVTGSVVVSFEEAAALKLVSAFSGMAMAIDSADFADAVGELANMIAGSAKGRFETLASISTPTVVIGGYTLTNPSNVPCLVIPCSCEHGEFTVEVNIRTDAAAIAA